MCVSSGALVLRYTKNPLELDTRIITLYVYTVYNSAFYSRLIV